MNHKTIIALTTSADVSGPVVCDGGAFSVQVGPEDPSTDSGTWTGSYTLEHFVEDWQPLYQDGSVVTLNATNTIRRLVGPMTFRVQKAITSVACKCVTESEYR